MCTKNRLIWMFRRTRLPNPRRISTGWPSESGPSEEWYAADFERRVSEITGVLRTQISEELRAQFTTELNAATERTRKQFEERAYIQFERWEVERQSMKKEIEELQARLPGN